MNEDPLDSYLQDLDRELRRRGHADPEIIEETREHLVDSIAAAQLRGTAPEQATLSAIARFGSPNQIAAQFMADRYRSLHYLLFVIAALVGILITSVDSRPTWDDTGITVFCLVLSGAVLGAIGPQRPWLWALAIGIWIPVHQITRTPTLAVFAGGLVIAAFPMVGAYCGMFCRRAVAMI